MKPLKYIKKAKGPFAGYINPWVIVLRHSDGTYNTYSRATYRSIRSLFFDLPIIIVGDARRTDIENMKRVGLI